MIDASNLLLRVAVVKERQLGTLETQQAVRYIVDPSGHRTDAVIPIATWQKLMAAWDRMIEQLEAQEDCKVLEEWWSEMTAGLTNTMSLDEFEQELREGGLVSIGPVT